MATNTLISVAILSVTAWLCAPDPSPPAPSAREVACQRAFRAAQHRLKLPSPKWLPCSVVARKVAEGWWVVGQVESPIGDSLSHRWVAIVSEAGEVEAVVLDVAL